MTKKTQAMDGPVSLAPWMDKERLTEKTSKTGCFILAAALSTEAGHKQKGRPSVLTETKPFQFLPKEIPVHRNSLRRSVEPVDMPPCQIR
ncbi:MAG: hypothetical protein ABIJ50_13325 [Pseudomonadota bacterium]